MRAEAVAQRQPVTRIVMNPSRSRYARRSLPGECLVEVHQDETHAGERCVVGGVDRTIKWGGPLLENLFHFGGRVLVLLVQSLKTEREDLQLLGLRIPPQEPPEGKPDLLTAIRTGFQAAFREDASSFDVLDIIHHGEGLERGVRSKWFHDAGLSR